MRIAAAEKMGYYPTPPTTLTTISQLLRPATKGGSFRFLDPCAGQGEALGQATAAMKSRQMGTLDMAGTIWLCHWPHRV
ncbi:MAG: hypothetical protein R2867_02695 [Caldilineaceae bacterium]